MLKYLQLSCHFDVLPLQKELSTLAAGYWKLHYNQKHYEGDWSIISLRSLNGDPENIHSVHATAAGFIKYEDTILLKQCPGITAVLDYFQCEKTAVRLMKLNAGAVIKEHSDYDLNFENGEVRFHIPVQTNEQVEFYVQDERVIMKEGECWYLNLNLPHRVCNPGSTDRIHLVIDCLVNDWLKQLFASDRYKAKEIAEIQQELYTPEQREKIIAELRQLNTSISNNLADEMETKTTPRHE